MTMHIVLAVQNISCGRVCVKVNQAGGYKIQKQHGGDFSSASLGNISLVPAAPASAHSWIFLTQERISNHH